MQDNILDSDQLSVKSDKALQEIELLRGAERKYEGRLFSARAAMLIAGIWFFVAMMNFGARSTFFWYNLSFGAIFLVSAYFAKFQPRVVLVIGLLIYTALMIYTFSTYNQPPQGVLFAFAFIMMVGQGLGTAQQLMIVRDRLEQHGEIPKYKQVVY